MFKLLQAVFITLMVAACSTTGSHNSSTDLGSFLVEGTGTKLEDAKADGFRKAIELAVGVAILSERESVNNKMAKQYILSHSSGYVENFTILDMQVVGTNPSKYKVMMRVFVKPTLVDDYVLYRSKGATDIDGHRADANVKTYLDSRASGNDMLKAVLNDFPEKAFEVKVLPPKVTYVASDGFPSINVWYYLKYSDKYVKSLGQVLDYVKDRDCTFMCGNDSYTVGYLDSPTDILPKFKTYYFNDGEKPAIIFHSLYENTDQHGNRFVAKVDFLDSGNQVLATICHFPPSAQYRDGFKGITAVTIAQWMKEPNGFRLVLDNWTSPKTGKKPYRDLLANLNRVDVTIVAPNKCKAE